MNGDNVSEISSPTLCNGCENNKNSLDNNKSYSLLNYHQITAAQNELISVQRSLIRELLKNSKEFQEKFGNNYDTKNSNHQEQQQTNKGGMECDAMQTDVESIRDEICFVKSFRDLVKGSNGKEKVNNNMKFGNVTSIKNNKRNDYTFDQNEQDDQDTGFSYSENFSQNHYTSSQIKEYSSSQIKENDNFVDTSTNTTNVPCIINEFPNNRNNNFGSFEQTDNLSSTSTPFPNNNDYSRNYNESNEINNNNNNNNGDFFGEYRGFNSIYVGIGKENIDVQQLKQCLEGNFGPVRFIRIIRNKVTTKNKTPSTPLAFIFT
ncbi:hypothetical protein C1645_755862 [Glomus cerebriforme]|uniref:Uncharacterized protein n=1 Tax=Glomus cerebriforme TaxID=658196 RepID=A0A397TDN7_9GLOM|nr:hypothetical protein C1645_755862 [Glomus cerebriforme]